MSAGPGSTTEGGFWRCGACGTPNPRASYMVRCVACGAPRPARVVIEPAPAAATRPPRAGGRFLAVLPIACAIVLLLVLLLMRWMGDRWWVATPLLYMPRALWLLPVVALAPLAWWRRSRRDGAILAACALLVLVPIMGFSLPWHRLATDPPGGAAVRILSLNCGHMPIDFSALQWLIERERIDVVCLQEVSGEGSLRRIFPEGWQHDSRWSIHSRLPIIEELPPSDTNAFREAGNWPVHLTRVRIRLGDGREAVIANAHMPTVRRGFELLLREGPRGMDRFADWRWEQLGALAGSLMETRPLPLLLGGDLNTPPDSPLMGLLRDVLRDGFDAAGWGYGYTRPASFPWVRIDHVLASPEWSFRRCWVGPDVGSDHRPVLAEAVLEPGGPTLPK